MLINTHSCNTYPLFIFRIKHCYDIACLKKMEAFQFESYLLFQSSTISKQSMLNLILLFEIFVNSNLVTAYQELSQRIC